MASHQSPSHLLTLELFSNLNTLVFFFHNWPYITLKVNMIMLVASKYDLNFVLKINTGLADLCFMVE